MKDVMDCKTTCSDDIVALNAYCRCLAIDPRNIAQAIAGHARAELGHLFESRPHLFASTAVFIDEVQLRDMEAQASAIEAAAASPSFRRLVAERANPPTAPFDTRGLFLGFDFHLSPEGPKLIEVNTNAGGAFLVERFERAVRAKEESCREAPFGTIYPVGGCIVRTLKKEFALARPEHTLRRVAIVDEQPTEQFLYPDMLLAAEELELQGIEAVICDPRVLALRDGFLWADGKEIDLVYNRSCDFLLEDPENRVLSDALQQGAAVVSPAPLHHALYADKRNLVTWTDADWQDLSGLPGDVTGTLGKLPETVLVTGDSAEHLWAKRKQYFFKPYAGFGSRAVYRGDKLTKRVWQDIIAGGYVAQKRVDPPLRALAEPSNIDALKFDIRLFRYAGKTELVSARIYQGQTTNLRTPGGGLGAVFVVPS